MQIITTQSWNFNCIPDYSTGITCPYYYKWLHICIWLVFSGSSQKTGARSLARYTCVPLSAWRQNQNLCVLTMAMNPDRDIHNLDRQIAAANIIFPLSLSIYLSICVSVCRFDCLCLLFLFFYSIWRMNKQKHPLGFISISMWNENRTWRKIKVVNTNK